MMIRRWLAPLPIAATLYFAILPTAVWPERKAGTVSEIVVDAQTGRTLHGSNAERSRPPASLSKMMTLLLVFDALEAGRLSGSDKIVMTAQGALQAPSRLGLARGRSISLGEAMKAVAVISANDVAVALADRLGGSEASFVQDMNRRAVQIGMTSTRFGNATGLAPGAGLTTARDMAVLARYIIRRYPERYKLFGKRSIRWSSRTRPNHNHLLGKVAGLDGVKTGYTVPAGFNLAASARRGDKRMIVVVMGAATAAERDVLVANLLESGFTTPAVLRKGIRRQRSIAPAGHGKPSLAR